MDLHFHLSVDPKTIALYCIVHTIDPRKKLTSDTHVFWEGNYTQEGVKTGSVKWESSRTVANIDAMAGKQEYKAMTCSQISRVSHYCDNLNQFVNVSIPYVNLTKKIIVTVALFLLTA